MDCSPIKLIPTIKDYLWGGRRLITNFNKKTELEKAAESWELSTHPDGESVVADGKFKDMTLSEYIKANGTACLGTNAASFEMFPILIKLIDAKDNLSIQVHPEDEYALRVEGEYGKTEMWYIVDCDKDAFLYYGLNCEISKAEFEERIKNNTLLEVLNKVPVHKGDVFFIPAGTVHAICSGILICEVQQNSNTTYRVYDYDRRGADGKPRELHIEKAIDVSKLCPPQPVAELEEGVLASCKYFTVRKLDCSGEISVEISDKSFHSLIVTEGCGTLETDTSSININKGDSIFIPAHSGGYKIQGDCELVLSYI